MDAKNRISNIDREERTEAVYLTLGNVEALIIGIPEMLAGVEYRLNYFSDKNKAVPELMEAEQITEEQALKICDDNINLSKSLIAEFPEIIAELKDVYPMLMEEPEPEEPKSKIILPYADRTTKSPRTSE